MNSLRFYLRGNQIIGALEVFLQNFLKTEKKVDKFMNDKDQNPSEFCLHVHALNKITIFLINYFSFQFECRSEGALIYGKLFWQNAKFNNSLSFRDCFFVGLIYSMLDDGFHF
jgi:hypothetical protein